jgi:hypothetical protein
VRPVPEEDWRASQPDDGGTDPNEASKSESERKAETPIDQRTHRRRRRRRRKTGTPTRLIGTGKTSDDD